MDTALSVQPFEIRSATIIPADNFIAFNGEGFAGCDFAVPEGEHPHAACGRHPLYGVVHAIQWWGDHGQFEYERGPAAPFKDVAEVEKYLQPWRERRAAVLRQHHDALAGELTLTAEALEDLKTSSQHLDTQIATLKATHAEAPKENRPQIEALIAGTERTIKRVREQHAHHAERHAHLVEAVPQALERATSAEVEAGE